MSYIIIWRNNHLDPHIDVDSRGFKEMYNSFESAKQSAEEVLRTENESNRSPWYFDYQIYEEVNILK
tara:strand:+ start:148 stop:348 length:201 start_codon:yes stop_codon:yes gene_type:complete